MELALRLGNAHLPAYASPFSRHDFTLAQLFACLVLRQFYDLDYRGLVGMLDDWPELRRVIGLARTPSRTTLCDAFAKIVTHANVGPMLRDVAAAFDDAGLLRLDDKPVAVDSSMFESRHVSRHFERRQRDTAPATPAPGTPAYREKIRATVRGLPKLLIAVAASCHLILAAHASTGAGSDLTHAEGVILDAWGTLPVERFVADAGFDAERLHAFVRQDLSCDLIVPAVNGCSDARPPRSPWRREAFDRLRDAADEETRSAYGQRWQIETTFSMMKRNFGSALRAHRADRREQELLLKAITHNLAV